MHRRTRALLVAAIIALLCGWSPNARAQLNFLDIDPPEGLEPCTPYPSDALPDPERPDLKPATSLAQAERECLAALDRQLADIDDSTEWLSAGSLVGGLGSVASALTSASTGTVNAWLGVGIAPIIADDIRQRPQMQRIFVEVRQNLSLMRCRSTLLGTYHGRLTGGRRDLVRRADALQNHLVALLEERHQIRTATTGDDAQLKLLVNEGFRIIGEVRRLTRRIEFLPAPDHIALVEQAAYNSIVSEFAQELRERNVSPSTAFRAIIAAPFRATARFLSPEGTGAAPDFAPATTPSEVSLTAAFVLGMQAAATTPVTWVGQGVVPSAYELETPENRARAHAIEAETAALLTRGMQAENDLSMFATLSARGNELCPAGVSFAARSPAASPETKK